MLCDRGGTVVEKRGVGMTENEAIARIKYRMYTAGQVAGVDEMEDLEMAIKVLEEIQQYRKHGVTIENALNNMCDLTAAENLLEKYRAIGAPEELQEMKKDFAEALSDWRQYRKVGTLEECRAAVEKQTAKRPRIMGNAMICPSCPRCFKSASPTYCPSCGQKLKWEDEE